MKLHRSEIWIWRSLGVVLLSLASSALIAVCLQPILHDQSQLLPFSLAVIAASSYAGLVSGIITTILSFVIADFFFMEPVHALLSSSSDYALLVVFLMFGCSLSILNHLLKRANRAVLERSEALARSNEELQRFASSVAHDLREPLRGIRAFTELFLSSQRGKLDEESARLLDYVLSGADRMKRLIDAILEFARAGKETCLNRADVDTAAVVRAALQHLQSAIDNKHATIRLEPLPIIFADEEQLLRVFLNLIGNAIKYHKGGNLPEIVVSARAVHNEWTISVKDNGIGIDPKYHDRIFDTFQRLHSASEYEGTGLGLATCKRIVQQHGGRIWVESEPGKGSTFCFTIPNPSQAAASRLQPPIERTHSHASE